MQRFKSILVGVDLSDDEHYVAAELPASTRAAVDKALWLAEKTSAHVTFLCAVMPDYSRFAGPSDQKTEGEYVYEEAREFLHGFQHEAENAGIVTNSICTCGPASLELTRAVIEGEHDLAIVGSHRRHGLRRLVLGSTGKKTLRNCPCPVWATSPHDGGAVRTMLAATDFSKTSDSAVQLAVSLADQFGAELHILHSIPQYAEPVDFGLPDAPSEGQSIQARANERAHEDFKAMLSRLSLSDSVDEAHQHVVPGSADLSVLSAVQELRIDLLVMGTAARRGLTGVLIGNTAELLLPKLTCSVLAVKPPGFHTRVKPHRVV